MIDLLHDAKLERHKNESKLYRARKGSWSLKTTVPDWIVNCLDLEKGDTLEWKVLFREDKPHLVLVGKQGSLLTTQSEE